MGFSAGGSFGKSKSSSNFAQQVWKPQGKALTQLYKDAKGLFDQGRLGMLGQIPGAINYINQANQMGMQGAQNQLGGGAWAGMGMQNQLMNSLNQSLNNPSQMQNINAMIMGGQGNNYADAMRNQYMQDAGSAQQMMLRNMDARAAASGMSGGSAHGRAIGQGMSDINQNLQSNLARTGYETFDADLNRKLNIAQQADQGTLARQQMLMQGIGNQNQAMQSGLDFTQNMGQMGQQTMQPWQQYLGAGSDYTNTIGDPTVLGAGSSKSSSMNVGAQAKAGAK